MAGIGQMAQVFQIQMFVSRYQLFTLDSEGIYQKVQKIVRHGPVIYKTAYGTYLAFFNLFLYLLHQIDAADGIVYHDVGISRYLDAITTVHFVAREDDTNIGFDNIFDKHQVIIFPMFGQFDETGHFTIWQFHYKVLQMVGIFFLCVFQKQADSQVEPVVA